MVWYDEIANLEKKLVKLSGINEDLIEKQFEKCDQSVKKKLQDEANKLFDGKYKKFYGKIESKKDECRTDIFLKKLVKMQESLLSTSDNIFSELWKSFEGEKKSARSTMEFMEALQQFFLSPKTLPKDRQLRMFSQMPLSLLERMRNEKKFLNNLDEELLILWIFEEKLKMHHTKFMKILEKEAISCNPTVRTKSIDIIYSLIKNQLEGEKYLLFILVNKLGDTNTQLSSRILYRLKLLCCHNIERQYVIFDVLQHFVQRPNLNEKTLHYALCAFNQFDLRDSGASKFCEKLICFYFQYFQQLIDKSNEKHEELNENIVTFLLDALRKALSYLKEFDGISMNMEDCTKILLRCANSSKHQRLWMLSFIVLQTLLNIQSEISEDYSSSSLSIIDRYFMALYKRLNDSSVLSGNFSRLNVKNYASFSSLIYSSIKNDRVAHRQSAFIKKWLSSVLQSHAMNFNCATLQLISTLVNKEKDRFITNYHNGKELSVKLYGSETRKHKIIECSSSWNHITNLGNHDSDDDDNEKFEKKCYDPLYMNPSLCGIEYTANWELVLLQNHYHPTLALWSKELLEGKSLSSVEYEGDPFVDFELIKFLDRFVYKNPKKISKKNNDNEEKKSGESKKKRNEINRSLYSSQRPPIDYSNVTELNEKSIPIDDHFFYHYERSKIYSKGEVDEDLEDFDDDEFDNYLSKTEVEDLDDVGDDLTSSITLEEYFETPKRLTDVEKSFETTKMRRVRKAKENQTSELSESSDDMEEDDEMIASLITDTFQYENFSFFHYLMFSLFFLILLLFQQLHSYDPVKEGCVSSKTDPFSCYKGNCIKLEDLEERICDCSTGYLGKYCHVDEKYCSTGACEKKELICGSDDQTYQCYEELLRASCSDEMLFAKHTGECGINNPKNSCIIPGKNLIKINQQTERTIGHFQCSCGNEANLTCKKNNDCVNGRYVNLRKKKVCICVKGFIGEFCEIKRSSLHDPSRSKKCVFPFYYNGRWFKKCTRFHFYTKWCSLTSIYRRDWSFC
ncbi:hypothetical protein SNEBB_004082 [Seison nebaliae]|nr:hypothetical protein SNEBB_004082 [Seison nebaliae]